VISLVRNVAVEMSAVKGVPTSGVKAREPVPDTTGSFKVSLRVVIGDTLVAAVAGYVVDTKGAVASAFTEKAYDETDPRAWAVYEAL